MCQQAIIETEPRKIGSKEKYSYDYNQTITCPVG